jgi:hypothetical protein
MTGRGESRIFVFFLMALIALYAVGFVVLKPLAHTGGDTPTYIAAAQVLAGQKPNFEFDINRVLTAPLTLVSIDLFRYVSGEYYVGWVLLNFFFFVGMGIVSFLFLRRLFTPLSAALGAYLICANYDVIVFGLRPLADIGGWFFYLLALYCIATFMITSSYRYLIYAALAIGCGGLFKEYAFLAVVPFAALSLYEWGRYPLELIKKTMLPAVLSILPVLVIHLSVYVSYHYTYLDWYQHNNQQYGYTNWTSNTIKSFGVVLNLLALPVFVGFALFFKEFRLDRKAIFLLSLCIPALFVLMWPSITERIVFLAVPTAAVFGCVCFDRFPRFLALYIALAALYTLISLTADLYLLNAVNLPF